MTYEEVSQELRTIGINAGEQVCMIRGSPELDATTLYVVPVAWFIAFRPSGELSMGIYEGSDNRLVGTHQVSFEKLTPESIKDEVDKALVEKIGLLLDPDILKEFLNKLPPSRGHGGLDTRRGGL